MTPSRVAASGPQDWTNHEGLEDVGELLDSPLVAMLEPPGEHLNHTRHPEHNGEVGGQPGARPTPALAF